ncbi:MAG: DUF2709 domain-containing protein [Parachlamydiaceae bacterium]|nr:DUF2709 domain-containing protein [Parachlamydiaceae bacterium]
MAKIVITEEQKSALKNYLKDNSSSELLNAYLFFIENKFSIHPVLYPKEKMIYQSLDDAMRILGKDEKIWHETEIKIGFSNLSVNDQTKKIYICPFTGKVFADNTHPNPQDAIYDWVSKCPENTERVGGLRVKRFFISEDSEVIKSYASKAKHKEPITKKVFSSLLSGKLFGSKEAVIRDFKENYFRQLSLLEVQNQNKFQIEEHFLAFIQKQLNEEKVGSFVESLAEHEEFSPYIEKWLE